LRHRDQPRQSGWAALVQRGRGSYGGGLDDGLEEEETPPPTVKVSDYVQWISKGAEQF